VATEGLSCRISRRNPSGLRPIDRLFRNVHAGVVMAPTGGVLCDFIGKMVLGMEQF
jgi:hypothetical protein